MKDTKKVYFAAPWFTAAQSERELRLIKRLRELGFEVFSPRESSNISGSFADKSVQEDTFNTNITNIDDCDILFAVTDGNRGICTEPDREGQPMQAIDVGTMIEAGYAYHKRRATDETPIIVYYAETLGNNQFNLMLARSADVVITDFKDLDYLPKIIENKEKVEFNGMIE